MDSNGERERGGLRETTHLHRALAARGEGLVVAAAGGIVGGVEVALGEVPNAARDGRGLTSCCACVRVCMWVRACV